MSAKLGTMLTATGFAVLLLGVSAGVGSGDQLGLLLLGLVGVLVGANFIAIGVLRSGKEPPAGPAAAPGAGVGALFFAAFLRRLDLAVVGLILASSAVTAVAGGEPGPVLFCGMFALFLLGLCLVQVPFLGEL